MLELIKSLANNGGVTLKNNAPITYKSGWQVATEGVEVKTAEEAVQVVKQYNGTCGVWLCDGIYYVDRSKRVNTKHEAVTIGREHNQISVYGWRTGVLAYC